MKSLKLFLIACLFSVLIIACNADSTNRSTEQGYKLDNALSSIETEEIEKEVLVETNEYISDTESDIEWQPYMLSTPAIQARERFKLPASEVQKIKKYFYNNIETDEVQGKQLDESDYDFYGLVQYDDNTILNYSFDKEKGEYLGKRFALGGSYALSKKFTDSNKDIVYKMLDVSGVKNPKVFFKELLDSPKITEYEGCTVQQKKAKYGMIELTSCELDDATALSLYNPKSE